jgi:hypothetical protein
MLGKCVTATSALWTPGPVNTSHHASQPVNTWSKGYSSRCSLIRAYQLWKGEHYEVAGLHEAIQWNVRVGPKIPDIQPNVSWWMMLTSDLKRRISSSVHVVDKRSKRGRPVATLPLPPTISKNTGSASTIDNAGAMCRALALGTRWDSTNYSCAYVSLFVIHFSTWIDNVVYRTAQLKFSLRR